MLVVQNFASALNYYVSIHLHNTMVYTQVIAKEHDAAVMAVATHPSL